MTKKSAGEKTREKILTAASETWPDISLETVAKKAGFTSHTTILYHFPKNQLREALAVYAVQNKISPIIVYLIAIGHEAVSKMSSMERTKHFRKVNDKW